MEFISIGMASNDPAFIAIGVAIEEDDDKQQSGWLVTRPVIPNARFASLRMRCAIFQYLYRIDLSAIADVDALNRFRFTIDDVFLLCREFRLEDVLLLPDEFGSLRVFSWEAIAFVLERLAKPSTLSALSIVYGRSMTALSNIFIYIVKLLEHRFRHILNWDSRRIALSAAQYASKIAAKCPIPNLIGFLDGTRRQHCKPIENQKASFNWHKWYHCSGFQGIASPDGLLIQITHAVLGAHNDQYILNASAIAHIMQQPPFSGYFLYADAGYSMGPHLIVPYKGTLSNSEQRFNTAMSTARVSVENAFGRVRSLWRFLNNDDDLMLNKSPLGSIYRTAVLFTNLRTCLDQTNQISAFFDLDPPTVREYLATSFL